MARNRMIKPDYWHDEKTGTLKRDIRLLFIGLWNISDDYGTVRANPTWIKSQLFPYDDDLRTDTITKWLAELVNARMLEPFSFNTEGFYNIRTFLIHQKVEKPSKPIVPLEEKERILAEKYPSSRGVVGEGSGSTPRHVGAEVEVEEEVEENSLSREKAFESFWDQYGKKHDRDKCRKRWLALKDADVRRIMEVVSAYVASTPDLKFRKNPLTWLTGKCWLDEGLAAEGEYTSDPQGAKLYLRDYPDWPEGKPFTYSNIRRFKNGATLRDDNT